LREHYGFEIGESTVQRITLGHAQAMFEAGGDDVDFPEEPGRHKQIVAQIDGGMIPVMTPDANRKDKRKGKTLSWREAKISLAHAQGSRTPVYGGGIEGGVEDAGRRLFACAVRAGFGTGSRVHAVGDGAPWIVGQIEERFGEQGSYLIDFYHVCEYLSAAAKMQKYGLHLTVRSAVVVGVRRAEMSDHAACSNFSLATGSMSMKVCIGVLPKHHLP
jgi:hypothetical protein